MPWVSVYFAHKGMVMINIFLAFVHSYAALF